MFPGTTALILTGSRCVGHSHIRACDHPSDSGVTHYGYGDTELGVKWRMVDEDALFGGSPQIGTFPFLELPTGQTSRGLGHGETQVFLPLWLQKSWGDEGRQWTLYGGGGYWINPGDGFRNYWYAGAVLQKQITDAFMLGGELYHATPDRTGVSPESGFNLGGVYDLSDQWPVLFSAGRDFHGPGRLQSYLALQLTF